MRGRKITPIGVAARIWHNTVVMPNGCWEWTGQRELDGYGRAYIGKQHYRRAHRIAYYLAYGDLGDMHVLHSCDNPPCINPDHLWLGTNADNVADRHAKGRSRGPTPDTHNAFRKPWTVLRGEKAAAAKLTAKQVEQIRQLLKRSPGSGNRGGRGGHMYSPYSCDAIADRFGVSKSLISAIKRGEVWGWQCAS